MRHQGVRALGGSLLASVLFSACGGDAGDADTSASRTDSVVATTTPPLATAGWPGMYSLRGTLEGSRQAVGTLGVEPMAQGSANFAETRARVQQTYPAYAGPFFLARMMLVASGDSTGGEFTCALGPSAESPPLVCHPRVPLEGLADATLVVQADGRAVLTGSHGEGVSIEYGRFSWAK